MTLAPNLVSGTTLSCLSAQVPCPTLSCPCLSKASHLSITSLLCPQPLSSRAILSSFSLSFLTETSTIPPYLFHQTHTNHKPTSER